MVRQLVTHIIMIREGRRSDTERRGTFGNGFPRLLLVGFLHAASDARVTTFEVGRIFFPFFFFFFFDAKCVLNGIQIKTEIKKERKKESKIDRKKEKNE